MSANRLDFCGRSRPCARGVRDTSCRAGRCPSSGCAAPSRPAHPVRPTCVATTPRTRRRLRAESQLSPTIGRRCVRDASPVRLERGGRHSMRGLGAPGATSRVRRSGSRSTADPTSGSRTGGTVSMSQGACRPDRGCSALGLACTACSPGRRALERHDARQRGIAAEHAPVALRARPARASGRATASAHRRLEPLGRPALQRASALAASRRGTVAGIGRGVRYVTRGPSAPIEARVKAARRASTPPSRG
jgi:hypothetical protein